MLPPKTMMFRKLYWVAEDIDATGSSQVRGVFTSVPNLLRNCLERGVDLSEIRLSLTRLDCGNAVIASWSGKQFAQMPRDLVQFVETEDLTEEQRQSISRWIDSRLHVAA